MTDVNSWAKGSSGNKNLDWSSTRFSSLRFINGGEVIYEIPDKGISLTKKAMAEIEMRLLQNPHLPKWDILIRHILEKANQNSY